MGELMFVNIDKPGHPDAVTRRKVRSHISKLQHEQKRRIVLKAVAAAELGAQNPADDDGGDKSTVLPRDNTATPYGPDLPHCLANSSSRLQAGDVTEAPGSCEQHATGSSTSWSTLRDGSPVPHETRSFKLRHLSGREQVGTTATSNPHYRHEAQLVLRALANASSPRTRPSLDDPYDELKPFAKQMGISTTAILVRQTSALTPQAACALASQQH